MSQTCILKHNFKEANYFMIIQPMPKHFDTISGGLNPDHKNLYRLTRRNLDYEDYNDEYFSFDKMSNKSLNFIHSIQARTYQKLPNNIVIKLVRFDYNHLNYMVKINLIKKMYF